MTFFEGRHPGQVLRRILGGNVTCHALAGKLLLSAGGSPLQFQALRIEGVDLRMAGSDQTLLFRALQRQTLQFMAAGIHAFADPVHFGFELLQQVARCHGLLFRLPLFLFQTFKQGSEFLDFPAQGEDAHLLVAQRAFQIGHQAQNIA